MHRDPRPVSAAPPKRDPEPDSKPDSKPGPRPDPRSETKPRLETEPSTAVPNEPHGVVPIDEPRLFLARFGELWLKGRNRTAFARTLKRNVRLALRDLADVTVERRHGQLAIHAPSRSADVLERLRDVFGIATLIPVHRAAPTREALLELAPAIVARALEEHSRERAVAFRVHTKRADKRIPLRSGDVDRDLGAACLARFPGRLRVDLSAPELTLEIALRDEGAFLFVKRIPGAGGLPVGSLGRTMCLLSGGIDSPVAAWYAMKRGTHASLVAFHSVPYLGDASVEKIRRLARVLARYQRTSRLFLAPFAPIQEAIRDACPEPYRTLLYRRMMQRIASRLARGERAAALVTGDSLGQVASQTLENLHCVERAAALPVLRPLIAHDKLETIAIARRIGTYSISSQPEPDCCTVFQPRDPVTRGRLVACEEAEKAIDVDALVATAVEASDLEVWRA